MLSFYMLHSNVSPQGVYNVCWFMVFVCVSVWLVCMCSVLYVTDVL